MKLNVPVVCKSVAVALLFAVFSVHANIVRINPVLDRVTGVAASASANQEALLPTLVFEQGVFSGFFFSVPNNTQERANTLDLNPGDYVSRFSIGFVSDSSDPVSMSVAFYDSDQATPPAQIVLPTIQGGKAVYEVTHSGLTGGGFLAYTAEVDLGDNGFIVPASGKMTMGIVYTDAGNSSQTCGGGVNKCFGPLLAGPGPGPAPGSNDFWLQFDPASWQGGTFEGGFFFGGFPPATFATSIWTSPRPFIPVPGLSAVSLTLLVLMMSGAAVLMFRRRRVADRSL